MNVSQRKSVVIDSRSSTVLDPVVFICVDLRLTLPFAD